MHNLNHFSAIPERPAGAVNPAELPLAVLVLETSQADLIPCTAKPTLYRRLKPLYVTLQEELWQLLFGHTETAEPAEAECRVIPIRQTA